MMYSSAFVVDAVDAPNAAKGNAAPPIITASTVRKTARHAHSRVAAVRLRLRTAGTLVIRIAHSPEERSWPPRLREAVRAILLHSQAHTQNNDREEKTTEPRYFVNQLRT